MKRKRYTNKDRTPVAVSCLSWLQRQILRNLQKTAINKFNKTSADKARELLVAINAKPNILASQTQSNPDITEASVDTSTVAHPTQNTDSKVWAFAGHTLKTCMNHVTTLGKRRRRLLPAHA